MQTTVVQPWQVARPESPIFIGGVFVFGVFVFGELHGLKNPPLHSLKEVGIICSGGRWFGWLSADRTYRDASYHTQTRPCCAVNWLSPPAHVCRVQPYPAKPPQSVESQPDHPRYLGSKRIRQLGAGSKRVEEPRERPPYPDGTAVDVGTP